MKILALGLNHKSAGVEIRERLAFDNGRTVRALERLKGRFYDAEFAILSTCNRVELYCIQPQDGWVTEETLAEFLSDFHNVGLKDFRNLLYVYENEEAVEHLLGVTSGLDSMMFGEPQILGQVKAGYRLACDAKSTGKVLNRLFHCAFATAKKIHTSTAISVGRVSVAGVAVGLAMQFFGQIRQAKVVVIGAGQTGELLIKHLIHTGCKDITVINRSHRRATDLANRYEIKAGYWREVYQQLTGADIVISSAAGDCHFSKDSLKKITAGRKKGMLIIDIAVPRNFEPSVKTLPGVCLYSIDKLSALAEKNRKARKNDITKCRQVINQSTSEFMDWLRMRQIGPLIGAMKQRFNYLFYDVGESRLGMKPAGRDVKHIFNRRLNYLIRQVKILARQQGTDEARKVVNDIMQQSSGLSGGINSNQELSA